MNARLWIAGCERARPRTRANRRARSVRAAIVRKWRGSNNSQRYLHRASMQLLPRDSAPVIARGQTLWKLFPSFFPPSFLPPSALFPSSSRGSKIRRDDQTQRFDISARKLPGRGETPVGAAVFLAVENVLHHEHGDGNSCGLFPEMFVVAAIERRGEEGRNEGWIDTRRNIEFLLIPSLRARTIERERERKSLGDS